MVSKGLTEKYQIRLSKDDAAVVQKIARAWRCDPAVVIRRALAEFLARNSYLDQEEKKALGVIMQT
jgi:predicted transcriptional regulator